MWSGFSSRSVSFLDRLLIVSIILGPAASYSIVYLFHFVLGAKLFSTGLLAFRERRIDVPRAVRLDVAFLLFFVGWYGLSLLWAPAKLYGLQYCAYVALGVLTVFCVMTAARTVDAVRALVSTAVATISLEVVLSIMEGLGILRLPFSPYSPYRSFFGRAPMDLEGLSEGRIEYAMGLPTGFMGNPNNLAAMLVLVLPLFLFARRWPLAVLGSMAIFTVINMAGARAALLGFWVVMAVALLAYGGNRLRTLSTAALVAVLMFGGGLLPQLTSSLFGGTQSTVSLPVVEGAAPGTSSMESSMMEPLPDVEAAGDAAARMAGELLSGAPTTMDSVGTRVTLVLNGLQALRDTYGLGVGAGGSRTVQENTPNRRNITAMHNFWVELLVDGGVLFAIPFFIWCGALVWRLWQAGRTSSQPTLRYLGQALSVGFVGFFFAAIGPSTVIYMLPMWMVIGLALATISLHADEGVVRAETSPGRAEGMLGLTSA